MIAADITSPATLLIYVSIVSLAALVHGAIGIGFPMIATPLLALAGDVRTAILLLVLPTLVLNLANIVRGGEWRHSIAVYWPLAACGVVGSLIGTRLLVVLTPEPFRLLLAAMLAIYLHADRLGGGMDWVHRHPRRAMAGFGLAAGVLAGTVNVMLPALIVYALEVRMPRTVMIQVLNFCFLLGKLTQGAVLAQAGLITADLLTISSVMAAVGLAVMMVGMRLRERIPTDVYRRWLRRLLAVLAAVLVVQFFVR